MQASMGSGEAVHSCLGTVRNNWPGASAPLEPEDTPQMNVLCSVVMFSEMFHTSKKSSLTLCLHMWTLINCGHKKISKEIKCRPLHHLTHALSKGRIYP